MFVELSTKFHCVFQNRPRLISYGLVFQVPYDHLVLSTGQQFQAPAPTGADVEAGDTNDTLPNSPNNRLLTQPPKNLYLINDAYDAAVALYRAETVMMKNQSELLNCSVCLFCFDGAGRRLVSPCVLSRGLEEWK